MDADFLSRIPTIQEFFKIDLSKGIAEGTRILLEAMQEVNIPAGKDVVTYGANSDDGMYIIIEGVTEVLSSEGSLINTLSVGDFIGELGLINDDTRGATVRAKTQVCCANISKSLFEEIASKNRKIYGTFMNMLYTKTTKLVTEQERIKADLAVATRIQEACLEHDFTDFNKLPHLKITARTRPAKEVGGDFYDIFWIDEKHLCFLIADVSGKGIPAALFMTMAKTHLKNYATLGLPLSEVVDRANRQLCYKNEEHMFVTAFVCVFDVETNEVTFVNAGHNPPFIVKKDGSFEMIKCKANMVLGMIADLPIPFMEQKLEFREGEALYLYTDGVTEALNPEKELLGDDRCREMLNKHLELAGKQESFMDAMYQEVDDFANGEMQADDITMVYVTRRF